MSTHSFDYIKDLYDALTMENSASEISTATINRTLTILSNLPSLDENKSECFNVISPLL